MSSFLTKYKIILIAILTFSPFVLFAQSSNQICSPVGYSIFTINGVFTNENGAIENRDELKDSLPLTFNNQPLTVDYFHNPSHLAGAGDILKSVYQGVFDNETVKDYDLIEILKSASEKVTTQKLLLVAHSQGNFYANSFYDVVADKDGGAPSQSLAIYSVATPSSRVAGEGKYITSNTDRVIAGFVARIQFIRKILSPNVHIELQEGDSSSGHGFSDIYLKYQGERIVSDIRSLLDRLTTNNIQDSQKPCLAPPKLSIAHKIKGTMYAVADPVVNGVSFVAFKLPTKVVKAGAEKVVEVVQTIKETFSATFKKDQFQLAQVVDLSQERQLNQSNQTTSRPSNFKQCNFATSQSPLHSKVIINEVAWMGGVNSANDEWIELKNISSGAVDLTGWQLIDQGEQIKIVFGKGSIISANGFYLLERTDDATVPEVKADVIYSGILSNSDEGIRLFDGGCNLIDETLTSSDWPAGDSKSRKTMERNSNDLNWYTSAVIGGTPKKENSRLALVKKQELPIDILEETEEENEEITPQQKEQTKQQEQIQQATGSPQQTANFKQCSFSANQSPSRQKIIINEVAWMGTINSANNEWIELKNISGNEINLNGWQLIDQGEQIKITFESKDKIQVNGFYLLERTDDNTVPNITANKIYTGALSNTNEGLRLFDGQCNLIDEVLANPSWPAGDNTSKQTMERKSDLSWQTSANAGGTPKAINSAGYVVYSGGGGGGGGAVSTDNQQSPAKILISEVQITGGAGKTENDFIELYNPNNSQLNLNGYRLVKRTKIGTTDTSIKSWTTDVYIPANGYYLWVNSGYTDIPATPDITTTATISNDNGVALRFGPNDSGTIIDSVAWGEAQNIFIEGSVFPNNPVANQSIQRKFQNNTFTDTDNNAYDFEIQTCPSPKSKNCSGANQAPSAFFVYSPSNPSVGDLIAFNAASSTDDGQIISYQWDFGDNATSSLIIATTTHSYLSSGTYSVSLIVFDNQNASSTIFSAAISVGINYLVISEVYPDKTGNNFDFVELYNPTNSSISLGDYSLRILKEGATSTDSLASFSASHTIAAKSFFLIGLDNYSQSTSTPADVSRSSSFLPTEKAASIILYNGSNSVDEFSYNPVNFVISQSFERKTFSGGSCVSAQNENEFLGNGCDIDSPNDFEIRNTPKPQNFSSFPEPRNAPTTPSNFSVQYSSSTMELVFNWQPSQDYSGVTSTLTYKITDISQASSTLATIDTASTTAEISINEFGRAYNFSIIAIDKEGYKSEKSEAAISVPQSSLIIAQQTDESSFEIGTGNGKLYQLLGNGLAGEPKEMIFHAKFLAPGTWKQTYYINATFWESDKSDYSNLIKTSSSTCTRDNPEATTYDLNNIYGSDCPNLNFEFGVDKDYIVPIQEPFVFDPAKYYKMTLFVYQSKGYFYGSPDEYSYLYGKSTRDNGSGAEVDSSSIKDLYFVIRAKSAFEVPLKTSQLTPQNFALSYSSSTYEISFNWDKPRYLENSTSTLTYKIIDVSNSSSTLPNIETTATSTKILINEIGRNYKFSIQAFDENGAASLTDEKEIKIPHSLAEKFIVASQLTSTSSEQGRTNGDFYQTLGAGLSGKLGAVTFKADFNPAPYHISIKICQSDDSEYGNCKSWGLGYEETARCNFNPNDGEVDCPNQITENIITVSASKDFTFDPTKYYKLYFFTYQSTPNFYGSADENAYPNGQATKYSSTQGEIPTEVVKDMYFILTSRTPLR